MRWTRGVVRLATTACVTVLVAAGLVVAIRAQPDEASFTGSAPQTTAAAPTVPAPTPAQLAPGVTLSARPTAAALPSMSPGSPGLTPGLPAPTEPEVTRTSTPPSAPAPTPTPTPPPTLDFELASFNVLGSSHTSSAGERPGMAPGTVRARWAAQLIRRHGADVVGFQELQGSQLATLQQHTDLDFFPGSSMSGADSENSIGWRRDTWTAVETHTVDIPYFNGNRRAMPYVRLRNLATGIEAWFANFHNPADTHRFHRQQVHRSRATEIQIALVNRLLRGGLPVFVTGDMNERDSYFCRLTSGAPMVAARGGSNNGACRPGNPRAVDWIFGSQGVAFTDYVEDRGSLVDRTTDHPLLVARVHLVGGATGTADHGSVSSD